MLEKAIETIKYCADSQIADCEGNYLGNGFSATENCSFNFYQKDKLVRLAVNNSEVLTVTDEILEAFDELLKCTKEPIEEWDHEIVNRNIIDF